MLAMFCRRLRWVALLVGGTALLSGLPAVALASTFAREVTSHGTPVSWRSSCVFITPDSRGCKDMPATSVFGEIQAAGGNWSTAAHACTYMQFMFDAPSTGNRA